MEGHEAEFEKRTNTKYFDDYYSAPTVDQLLTPYDRSSVMHDR